MKKKLISELPISIIIFGISFTVPTIIGNKLANLLILSKYKNAKPHIEPTPIATHKQKLQINNNLSEINKSNIEKMYNILKEIPHINLTYFNKNIETLKAKKKTFILDKIISNQNVLGQYDPDKNILTYNDKKYDKAIFHELFHLSSSTKINNISYSGFSQSKGNILNRKKIGECLNEGYTEILTDRYFYNGYRNSYQLEKFIASKLEQIIGQAKMEELYFKADLYNLIKELEQHNTKEKIIKFMKETEYIHRALPIKRNKKDNEYLHKCLFSVCDFLIETYTNKMIKQYENKEIIFPILCYKISSYVDSFKISLEDNKEEYHLLNEDSKIYQKSLKYTLEPNKK